jgi:hypothetical protein
MRTGAALEIRQERMRQQAAIPAATLVVSPGDFAERHYSVAEISQMWQLSPDSVRKLFEREPGVLAFGGDHTTGHKRRYTTLRVPESVAARVHRRLSTVGGRKC